MKTESFIEQIYFGDVNLAEKMYSESSARDPAVEAIFAKYLDAIKGYPSDMLEDSGRVPDSLLDRLREIGFFGLFIPTPYGGVGLSLHQYLALVREIVMMDMAIGILSLAHLSIGMKAILLFGNESQKRKYLPLAASGKMIFCYALTEPLFGSDAKNIDTVAELSDDGSHYILNGTKAYITNANYAGGLTVFAQMDKGKKGKLGAFIVETAWDGVTAGKDIHKMGLIASSTASFHFKNVRVPKENLIGAPGEGFKIAMTVLNYGRLALGAASCGMLEASITDMIKRAKSRIQFDRPIIEFELIQEKIARAIVDNETIWAMTNFTAGLLTDDPVAHVAIESSHCKLYGTNRAWETLYNAMQLAGGSGYLKAQPYEKRMRDFRVATIFEGTSEIHSLYPSLSAFRNIFKYLSSAKKSSVSRFVFVMVLNFKPAHVTVGSDDPMINKSVKTIDSYTRVYRKLFVSSLKKYGRNISEREFVLRRLTTISIQIYALICLIQKIRFLPSSDSQRYKLILALESVIAESRNIVKMNSFSEPDDTEKVMKRVLELVLGNNR